MTDKELATRIARALFTNGQNEVAVRLQLRLQNERDGGGWCREAAIDVIERVILDAREERRR